MLAMIRERLFQAQQYMTNLANEKRREVEFAEGEWAYLKLCPYRQGTLSKPLNAKLAPQYVGPFKLKCRLEQWLID